MKLNPVESKEVCRNHCLLNTKCTHTTFKMYEQFCSMKHAPNPENLLSFHPTHSRGLEYISARFGWLMTVKVKVVVRKLLKLKLQVYKKFISLFFKCYTYYYEINQFLLIEDPFVWESVRKMANLF